MDGAGPFQSPEPSLPSKSAVDPSTKALSNPTGSTAPRFPDGYILNETWILKRRIGQGRYSDVYAAVSNNDGSEHRRRVAIKVEKKDIPSEGCLLKFEATVLSEIQDCPFVCRMHESGALDDGGFYIVMDLCSETLSECRKRQPGGQFPLHKGVAAAMSMLNCIEALHRCGFVHRDIKPSNFVRPLRESKNLPKSIMIDFGLARRHHQNGVVLSARPTAEFRGTSKYASLNSHFCKELGPRDDMFSFLFVLLDFVLGKLPWSGCSSRNAIASMKRKLFGRAFIRNDSIPAPIYDIAQHLNTLRFQDNPDYNLVRNLVQELGCRRLSLPLTPSRPHSPLRIIPEISEDSSPMKRLIRPFCEYCLTHHLCEDLDCLLLHPPSRRAFVLPNSQALPLCLDFIRGTCRALHCERHHWTETEESVYLRTGCLPVRSSSGSPLPSLSLPNSSVDAITNELTLTLTPSPVHHNRSDLTALNGVQSTLAMDLDPNANGPSSVGSEELLTLEPKTSADAADKRLAHSSEDSTLLITEIDDQISTDLKDMSLNSTTEFDCSNELSSQSSIVNVMLPKKAVKPPEFADVPENLVKRNGKTESKNAVPTPGIWESAALNDAFRLSIKLDEIESFEKFLMSNKDFRPLMELDEGFVSFEHVLWSEGILLEQHLSDNHPSEADPDASSRRRRSTARLTKQVFVKLSPTVSSDSEDDDSTTVTPRSKQRNNLEKSTKPPSPMLNPNLSSDVEDADLIGVARLSSRRRSNLKKRNRHPSLEVNRTTSSSCDGADSIVVASRSRRENNLPKSTKQSLVKLDPAVFSDSEDADSTSFTPQSRRRSNLENPITIRLKLARKYRSQRQASDSIHAPGKHVEPDPSESSPLPEKANVDTTNNFKYAPVVGSLQCDGSDSEHPNLDHKSLSKANVSELTSQEPGPAQSTLEETQVQGESLSRSEYQESEYLVSHLLESNPIEPVVSIVTETVFPPRTGLELQNMQESREDLESAFQLLPHDSSEIEHHANNSELLKPELPEPVLLESEISSLFESHVVQTDLIQTEVQECLSPHAEQSEHSSNDLPEDLPLDLRSKSKENALPDPDSESMQFYSNVSADLQSQSKLLHPDLSASNLPTGSVYCNPRIRIRIKRNMRKGHEIQNTFVVLRLKRSVLQLPIRQKLDVEEGGSNGVPSFSTLDFAPFLFGYLSQTKDEAPGLVIPDPTSVDQEVACGETLTERQPNSGKPKAIGLNFALQSDDLNSSRGSDRSSLDESRGEGQPRESPSLDPVRLAVTVLGNRMNLGSEPVLIRIKRSLLTEFAVRKRSRIS